MFIHLRFVWAVVALWSATSMVHAFSFTTGTPSQCDNITISWTGGTAPYQLLLTPIFGNPRNFSIPPTAFSNGQGTFSITMPLLKDRKFLLTMSDATGFGSGGSTGVLVVGESQGGKCDTTEPALPFSFELNTSLQQCRPYTFSGYSGAVQPVTILGIIPGGSSFTLHPPSNSVSFDWKANVASGTSIVFLMTDSQGHQGGSSDIEIVALTDDNTCLNRLSPSSTITSSPATTSTALPKPDQTSAVSTTADAVPSTSPTASTGTPVGAIAGTVIGALLFFAMVITLGLFFLRRKRNTWAGNTDQIRRQSRRMQSEVNLTYDPEGGANAPSYLPASGNISVQDRSAIPRHHTSVQYGDNPFIDSFETHSYPLSQNQTQPNYRLSSSTDANLHIPSHHEFLSDDPFNPSIVEPYVIRNTNPSPSRSSTSTTQRKAGLAGISSYKPARFILHTDVEDDLPPPDENDVIELPPQYSERRNPEGGVPDRALPDSNGTLTRHQS